MTEATVLEIILDGEGAAPELQGKKIHRANLHKVMALPGGMRGGRTSVALIIPLEDGSVVMAETSLRLFQQASAAFTGKYGSE